ncbi:MAG: DUF2207 domain-containing protein [Clostridia bacterium]|nr:DUF2207 domain-containing protein [Clostridia bacterium]
MIPVNLLSLNVPQEIAYIPFAAGAYGCIFAVLVLALIFGPRARRNVKRQKITELPKGLSPLDIQRIFIGKTSPQKLTRALLVWWAQNGYIRIEQVGRYKVRVKKLKGMPYHNDGAEFFDRGTYVRERYLFGILEHKILRGDTINLLKPLFTKEAVKKTDETFAVREDDGVYSAKHYQLKIFTLVLCCMPLVFTVIWNCVCFSSALPLLFLGTAAIGYFVLMFARTIPIFFKLLWCGLWLFASFGGLWAATNEGYDPAGIYYAAIVIIFAGSFVLLRFVDYREKINLDDYSMLINYRRYLLFTPGAELVNTDYYSALPYIYAFKIKPLVRRKYGERSVPEWYVCKNGEKGALL